MGKNSDTNNIFSSYMDNVLLKEAVRSTEDSTPQRQLTPQEEEMRKQKGWSVGQARIMFDRAKEIKDNQTPYAQAFNKSATAQQPAPTAQQPAAQPAPVSQPAAPTAPTAPAAPQPTQQPQADDESGYEEVETTQETIPANVQAQPLVTADDGTSYTVDQIKNMIGDVTKSFDQDEQESDDEGWEEMGSSGDKENVTDKYETVISGNTTTIRPKNLKEPFEDQDDQEEEGWQEVGEPETENVTDQYTSTTSETQYKESVNISKFLKSLSEKNYSLANKYLKNIVENKIKRKISGAIK